MKMANTETRLMGFFAAEDAEALYSQQKQDLPLPGFSVHGIPQASILEWITMPSSRGSSRPRDQTQVSCIFCISGRFFIPEPPGKPKPYFAAAAAKLLQSCLTLCDPIDGSPPGLPVPGILQARTLEWVAISFSSA